MALSLTGFGGVEEIGGNAFLLDDGDSRIFLDFGRRFGNDPYADAGTGHMLPGWSDYFDEFLQPRSYRMAQDLMTMQVIPEVPAAYRPDIGGTPGDPEIDAVVVSHAHADHVGLIGLLKPQIPILMSQESQSTVDSLQKTSLGGAVNEFTSARTKGYGRKENGDISTRPKRAPVTRNIQQAETADIGNWDIRQFTVDHSIHGARATLLEGTDATIVYTGDFRMHGRLRHETAKFIERAGGADILITEGTNVHQDHKHHDNDDEVSVEGDIEDIASDAGFVAIAFPPRDLDRFLSVWHVAKRLGRRLVIPTKQAHLIESLRAEGRDDLPDPFADAHLAVHIRNRGRGTISSPGQIRLFLDGGEPELIDASPDDWGKVLASEYQAWEKPFLQRDNTVTSAEIGKTPNEWMFSISYWSITDLLDIFPERNCGPDAVYIHSMTQPFNDDMQIGDRKLRRWLDAFGLRYTKTHVSGHLSEDDLIHCIDEVGPKVLVPIHSLHPAITAQKYEARSGQRAVLPAWGKPVPIA